MSVTYHTTPRYTVATQAVPLVTHAATMDRTPTQGARRAQRTLANGSSFPRAPDWFLQGLFPILHTHNANGKQKALHNKLRWWKQFWLKHTQRLPWWPSGEDPTLPPHGARVPSLAEEPRPHMPWSSAKHTHTLTPPHTPNTHIHTHTTHTYSQHTHSHTLSHTHTPHTHTTCNPYNLWATDLNSKHNRKKKWILTIINAP